MTQRMYTTSQLQAAAHCNNGNFHKLAARLGITPLWTTAGKGAGRRALYSEEAMTQVQQWRQATDAAKVPPPAPDAPPSRLEMVEHQLAALTVAVQALNADVATLVKEWRGGSNS